MIILLIAIPPVVVTIIEPIHPYSIVIAKSRAMTIAPMTIPRIVRKVLFFHHLNHLLIALLPTCLPTSHTSSRSTNDHRTCTATHE